MTHWRVSWVLAAAVFLLVAAVPGLADDDQIVWLSVPPGDFKRNERIVGFELKVAAGAIRSVPNVPAGWYISISNDAAGVGEMRGNAQVGAAALEQSYFNSFVSIERRELDDLKFWIELEVVLTIDFVNERHAKFDMDKLVTSSLLRK